MNIKELLVRQLKRIPKFLIPGLILMVMMGAYLCYQGAIVENSAAVTFIGLGLLGFVIWYFLSY